MGVVRHSLSLIGASLALFALGAAAAGCVHEVESEDVGQAEQPIRDGVPADLFSRQRSARITTFFSTGVGAACSAMIVGPRHVLTAAHCAPSTATTVRFYTSTDLESPPPPDPSTQRTVTAVFFPPGVTPVIPPAAPENGDFTDTSGRFADIALLRLNADIPSTSQVANMAFEYPGEEKLGTKVGAARVSALIDDSGWLRMVADRTWSSSDSSGPFFTEEDHTDPGDSGGPFFYASRALGVLNGSAYPDASRRNKYTSIPRHLAFILTSMNYSFSGATLATGTIITGDDLKTFSGRPANVCAYACETSAQCVGFNHFPQLGVITNYCQLKKTISGAGSIQGATSGLK